MNEKLKGFRTILLTWLSVAISAIDTVRELVTQLVEIVGPTLGEGGAVAALIAVVITAKAWWTDARKRLKGELTK